MAKKKDDADGASLQYSGDNPAEGKSSVGIVGRIETEEMARALVKTLYEVPKDCFIVFVTEDRNVFWQEVFAVNHAQKQNLKLFRLPWA